MDRGLVNVLTRGYNNIILRICNESVFSRTQRPHQRIQQLITVGMQVRHIIKTVVVRTDKQKKLNSD